MTKDDVLKLYDYDKETGIFFNKKTKKQVGKPKKSRYIKLSILGKTYQAHRIAFFLEYGKMPIGQIDHIDGDRYNNKIENLRDVCSFTNCQNQFVSRKNNKLGFAGVRQYKNGRFAATITVGYKNIHLGYFKTPHEAHEKYIEAKKQFCSIL